MPTCRFVGENDDIPLCSRCMQVGDDLFEAGLYWGEVVAAHDAVLAACEANPDCRRRAEEEVRAWRTGGDHDPA